MKSVENAVQQWSRCAKLIETYPRRLAAVLQPKVVVPNIDPRGGILVQTTNVCIFFVKLMFVS